MKEFEGGILGGEVYWMMWWNMYRMDWGGGMKGIVDGVMGYGLERGFRMSRGCLICGK